MIIAITNNCLQTQMIIRKQAYAKASNPDIDDAFGASIDVSGNTMVVGSTDESSASLLIGGSQSDNSAEKSGAAYVYEKINGQWRSI